MGEWKIILENRTANVLANLDNPIKSYDFSKFRLIFACPLSEQLSYGTAQKFHKILLFIKIFLPSTLIIFRDVKAKMDCAYINL